MDEVGVRKEEVVERGESNPKDILTGDNGRICR